MFRRLARGLRHTLTIGQALPVDSKRTLLRRMIALSRNLPQQFDQPLPIMLDRLTPARRAEPSLPIDTIRQLADAVAAWDVRSPLGICLRRSLLRYHFLREADVHVTLVFGARLKAEKEGAGIGGHAWLRLNEVPYYENPDDYEGFVEMYVYPPEDQRR